MKTFPPSPIALEIYILFAPLDLLSALSLPTLYSGGQTAVDSRQK